MLKTLEDLRKLAEDTLEKNPRVINYDKWRGDLKKLLNELSVYQVELEHQNLELEHAEQALAASHAEYVKLFESTPVGYVILNSERKIVRANTTFINFYVSAHIKNAQLVETCFDDFICPEFKNAFALFCKMAQQQRIPVPIELKLLDLRVSTPHYVLLTGGIYDADKKYIGITVSDISMQKKLELQLAHAKDKAENADQKKSVFLTNVSYEMRTPLTTIIGYGNMLRDPKIDMDRKMEYLDSITENCKLLLSFCNNVLNISSLESGSAPLRNDVVDVKRLSSDITTLVLRENISKSVIISVSADGIPALWIDALRLSQIISSILNHAIANITSGTINVSFKYDTPDNINGVLKITISGNEIFSSDKVFGQVVQHASMLSARTMLDLFLAKRIVSAMAGKMIWEHPMNLLHIEIPAKRPPFNQPEPNVPSQSGIKKISKKSCIIVDDVVMNLRVLAAMLKRIGYTVDMAVSGKDALDLTNKKHYDLVMTDLWMPEMNGEEFAVLLRKNPLYDNVHIIAVTADVERKHNFNMEYFSATIIKPVSIEKLVDIIGSLAAK